MFRRLWPLYRNFWSSDLALELRSERTLALLSNRRVLNVTGTDLLLQSVDREKKLGTLFGTHTMCHGNWVCHATLPDLGRLWPSAMSLS